jgi:hypothetical protein
MLASACRVDAIHYVEVKLRQAVAKSGGNYGKMAIKISKRQTLTAAHHGADCGA